MKRTRVVQVTHDLGVGGLPRVVVTLCKALDRTRYDVSVLCLRGAGPLAAELAAIDIPVHVLDRDPERADYLAFRKTARVFRDAAADVVHTHNTEPFIDGGIGARLAGVPCVVHTDHARAFPDKRRYMAAEFVLSHFVHRVVGVSDHTTANLRRYERISPRKLLTIPNGIEDVGMAPAVDRAAKLAELGLPTDARVIGFAARLSEQKGIRHLLDAMVRIRERVPAAVLLIAGEGELESELRRRAETMQLGDSVRFLGVRLDIPELLQIFDVWVMSSIWEGLPMALLEAMATRRAIVSTAVGGVPDVIEDGRNGVLVPPADAAALAAAIVAVLDDPVRSARIGEAARATFAERFSAATMARQYEALYEEGLARRDGRRRSR